MNLGTPQVYLGDGPSWRFLGIVALLAFLSGGGLVAWLGKFREAPLPPAQHAQELERKGYESVEIGRVDAPEPLPEDVKPIVHVRARVETHPAELRNREGENVTLTADEAKEHPPEIIEKSAPTMSDDEAMDLMAPWCLAGAVVNGTCETTLVRDGDTVRSKTTWTGTVRLRNGWELDGTPHLAKPEVLKADKEILPTTRGLRWDLLLGGSLDTDLRPGVEAGVTWAKKSRWGGYVLGEYRFPTPTEPADPRIHGGLRWSGQ